MSEIPVKPKIPQGGKQHFELSPANRRRLDDYLERFNTDPSRVSPKMKTADVVNRALDLWLRRHEGRADAGNGGGNAKKDS